MPGPYAPDELERREQKVDAAEYDVERHDRRILREAGVVRLKEIVCGRRRDAHKRQESDHHAQRPSPESPHRLVAPS
jgi:hypothetical protein